MRSIYDDDKIFNMKTFLFIIGFSVFTGAFLGSWLDLFTLSYLGRFPYRVPFNRIVLYTTPLLDIGLMITFIVYLIQKETELKNKISVFIIVGIISVVFTVVFAIIWTNGIDWIHDLKRFFYE